MSETGRACHRPHRRALTGDVGEWGGTLAGGPMTDTPSAGAPDPDRMSQSELDRLAFAVTDRFALHLRAAQAAVREAEQSLEDARDSLALAEQAAADTPYQSDPLVFMRATVGDDLEGWRARRPRRRSGRATATCWTEPSSWPTARLTNYRRDLAASRRDRVQGWSRRQAVQVSVSELAAAKAMHERVLAAGAPPVPAWRCCRRRWAPSRPDGWDAGPLAGCAHFRHTRGPRGAGFALGM